MFKKGLVLAAVVFMVLAGSAVPAEKENGLVSYWNFDEGKGTVAKDSAGKNDGQIIDAKWVDGKIGKALHFNGESSYVAVPDSDSLNVNNAITIEAWVKHEGDNFKDWETILAKGNGSYRLHMLSGSHVFDFGFNVQNKFYDISSEVIPDADKWYFVAATYDGQIANVYINGARSGYLDIIGAIDTNGADIYIGENNEAIGRFFKGIIDEVKIYNRVLSAQEIQDQYNKLNPNSIAKK